jgi:hypothetical protein
VNTHFPAAGNQRDKEARDVANEVIARESTFYLNEPREPLQTFLAVNLSGDGALTSRKNLATPRISAAGSDTLCEAASPNPAYLQLGSGR